MLDIKYIHQNTKKVQDGNEAKGFKVDIAQILALDNEIRPLQQELEQLQADRNKISQEIPKTSPEKRESLKKDVLAIKQKMDQLEPKIKEGKAQLDEMLLK